MKARHRSLSVLAFAGLALTAAASAPSSGTSAAASAPVAPTSVRRLNEQQYIRSIHDIFGADIKVPGRFEPVSAGQPFAVLVDYAHTPDSLETLLRAARGLGDGRVIVVFGAGGDRDRGKRPLMGRVAAQLADHVIVTSDNPRSEDPVAIIAEVLQGTGVDVEIDPDRRTAIERAVAIAAEGDVVVIAGKGHERGQEIAGVVHPFDDRAVARDALLALARQDG